MPDFLLGNPLRAWTTAGLVALATIVTLYIVRYVIGRRLAAVAATTDTQVDDIAAELTRKVRWYFIIAIAIRAGSVALALPDGLKHSIRQVAAIAILLQLAAWGNTLISFWLRRWGEKRGTTRNSATLGALRLAAQGAMWTILAVLALRNVLDYDVSALLTGLGIGGIAIALAVQNILGDLFAALSIVLDKPFEVGDSIAVDTFQGRVEHVGLKTTRIRSLNGEQVIFANTDLLKSRVRNLHRIEERRVLMTLGVTYDTPPAVMDDIPGMLKRCVEERSGTRFGRAHFAGYGDSALNVELEYFVAGDEYVPFMDIRHAVNLAILTAFNEAGINFAFPTRTVINQTAGAD